MKKYPSAQERENIIARRKQLGRELISGVLIENEKKRTREINRLIRRYGQADVERELDCIQQRAQAEA